MALKLKFRTQIPAALRDGTGITVRKDGLLYYFDLDYSEIDSATSFDPTTEEVLVQSSVDGSFAKMSLATLLSASQTIRVITAAGDVNVAVSDSLIILNKTISEATNVNLPLSVNKIGKVKIVDWKGDSGLYPITVNNSGSETFNGAQSSWDISAAGASVAFDPIPSLGYAV